MDDLYLQVDMQKGDDGEQEILCDSKFMIGVMDELGNSTRTTYRGIGVFGEDNIDPVMGNVVGHDKNEDMLEYSEYLVATVIFYFPIKYYSLPKQTCLTLVHG